MKMRRVLPMVLIFVLMGGVISVDSAATAILPGNVAWTTEHVDRFPDAEVGTHVALAYHPNSGRIYVSYFDEASGDLKMASQVTPGTGNCGERDEWTCQVIDSTGIVGMYSSIEVSYVPNALNPVLSYTIIGISYYDSTNGALKYAQWRSNSPGNWVIEVIEDSGIAGITLGTYTSLEFNASLKPSIAYHAQSTAINRYGAVKYAYYLGDGTGNCGDDNDWHCDTVDSRADYPTHGTHISMDAPYGGTMIPVIAFYNAPVDGLELADYYGFGGDCSNDEWDCTVVDAALDVGKYVSLHAIQSPTDKTRLAYYDATRGEIKYAISASGGGGNCTSTAFDCYVIDTVGTPAAAFDISMAMDAQGYPIIAYMNASEAGSTTLDLARPAAAYGLAVGNCGDVPPGMLFQTWRCRTVDAGNGLVDEAEYVAVGVGANGLAAIAYSEYDRQGDNHYLKVAQQSYRVYLPLVLRMG